ncbi:hypothetical protein [Bradyrhizobium sp.]|uniref:hypothetical protein n=1 Tax=Bradyrhizobium sp. TaxID=376 RepID=UPI002D1FB082|nr:hypothetical protein [Bradyrhizobium sp.]
MPLIGLMFRRLKPLGLGRQVTGDALVEPALNLGSQMNKLGSHNDSPLQVPGSKPDEPGDARIPASAMDIACPADRFQYLSVNNP